MCKKGGANGSSLRCGADLRKWRVLTRPEIEPAEFRAAMRNFPAAVHVAATDGASGRRGLTVSAACSVSDKPATILVCLNTTHPANALFRDNGCFALNTLSEAHVALARAFANSQLSQAERFATGSWQTMVTGAPALVGAAAVFDCDIVDIVDAATHQVVFGRVRAITASAEQPPLLYANRQFHALGGVIA
jgi:cob(II)yrinic acid a,c-diamide reductase